MSLHLFKETLRPCTKNPLPSLSSASITHSFDPIIPRKPPKSSLSQQLLRLQDPDSLPPIQPRRSTKQPQGHSGDGRNEEAEEEEEEQKQKAPRPKGFGRTTKLGQFQFDHTGPFEPLVLSSQNGIPLVQVIIYLPSFFLLEPIFLYHVLMHNCGSNLWSCLCIVFLSKNKSVGYAHEWILKYWFCEMLYMGRVLENQFCKLTYQLKCHIICIIPLLHTLSIWQWTDRILEIV